MGIFDWFRRRRSDRPAEGEAPGLFTARSGAVPPALGGTPGEGANDDLWDRPAPAGEPVAEPVPEAVPEPAAEPVAEPVAEVEPAAEEPEVEALSAFDPEPPAAAAHVEHTDVVEATPEPAWDESTWEDDEAADADTIELPADGGSTADEPLFGDHEEEAPAPVPPPPVDPVPPLFDHPPVVAEPAPADLVDEPTPASPPAADPPITDAAVPDAEVTAPDAQAEPEAGRTMRVHDGRLDKRPGPIRMTPSEAIALAQDGPQALRRRTPPDT